MNLDIVVWQQIAGGAAVLVGLVGYLFYMHGIWYGSIKPHFFSWFVWGVLTSIAFVAQVAAGAGPGAWVTGFTAVMCFFFAGLGLRAHARELIARSDWFFFIGAFLAIPVWYVTGNPLWSVIMITIIDAVAFVPTFRKAYTHPETENISTYLLSAIKYVLGIAALSSLTFVTWLYPASLVIANSAFIAMLLWRRKSTGA